MLALSFIPNQFLYPWTADSLSYLYRLSTPWLRLTKKYILSISQRPQSHKIQAISAQANSRITHRHENKNKNRHTSFTFKAISQHLHLWLSLSQEETISHTSTESARRRGNEREEKKYNVPPSLRRGKSFRRGSLQTRTGNEIILADLRSCVFVINYGLWRGIYLRECGRRWEPRKCVIITTNRQTDKQNRRTLCYVAQSQIMW